MHIVQVQNGILERAVKLVGGRSPQAGVSEADVMQITEWGMGRALRKLVRCL